ncbi:ZYRO0F14938p [Zygosaccharomyces rouxii]|uniref:ZYRO0F14938p n=1 Tax=Zygosaccharomyces rouxii (strain ATCC 2623 / CBS 732 / NBRC 1130 / NCYC 568 / NRRL Y-229) TaxID=559307 RepID=C5DYQ6_ZYGRC|nr:uncharacterized protein ZYRO0F14938g [Zygosaccharomyces rouxii]KAH9199673.1 tRNA synthetases class II-domain-containing protein [Zygosaccharomyces rouxii]CAR28917.1 ZYRO0F14938p [Zygosaccharomyces rouxii]
MKIPQVESRKITMILARSRLHTFSKVLRELPALDIVKPRFEFQRQAQNVKQSLACNPGDKVVINGWIDKKPRKIGKELIFGEIRDSQGDVIQVVDSQSFLKNAAVEDVVQVQGSLALKKGKKSDEPKTSLELKLESVATLNGADKRAADLQDFKTKGAYPPEYRYLQLRLPKFQQFLQTRYQLSKALRQKFDELGFTEIETPILFKSTPEGAREFLVPTRRTTTDEEPTFYALPQSPQQYKQLLMASGINRYFQVAKCFRDEDLRADRQPEFTQLDLEMAFANGEDVMQSVEEAVTFVWKKLSRGLYTLDIQGNVVPVSESQPVRHMSYRQAMSQYGIDKPDLCAPDLKILDLSEFRALGNSDKSFPIFEVLILRNAFDDKKDFNKKWSFLKNPEHYNYRTPKVVPILNEQDKSQWVDQFLDIAFFENPKLVAKALDLQPGDIICGSTRQDILKLFENPTPLGKLRQLVMKSNAYKDKLIDQDVAVWIKDFPLFSPVEKESSNNFEYPEYEEDRVESSHHPFTMVQIRDYAKLGTNPTQALGQHYDLVVNGVELGGGSTRVHDPQLQEYIFEEILKIKEPHKVFGHLLEAFKMGTPPHAGFAIGFDRMCAMLCGTESIRDVMAFPKSVTGSDLVVGSPSTVKNEALEQYNVFKKK